MKFALLLPILAHTITSQKQIAFPLALTFSGCFYQEPFKSRCSSSTWWVIQEWIQSSMAEQSTSISPDPVITHTHTLRLPGAGLPTTLYGATPASPSRPFTSIPRALVTLGVRLVAAEPAACSLRFPLCTLKSLHLVFGSFWSIWGLGQLPPYFPYSRRCWPAVDRIGWDVKAVKKL